MKWTITSPGGQVLYGSTADNGKDVNMTSKVGNHGQYTRTQWDASVAKMRDAGYKIEITE